MRLAVTGTYSEYADPIARRGIAATAANSPQKENTQENPQGYPPGTTLPNAGVRRIRNPNRRPVAMQPPPPLPPMNYQSQGYAPQQPYYPQGQQVMYEPPQQQPYQPQFAPHAPQQTYAVPSGYRELQDYYQAKSFEAAWGDERQTKPPMQYYSYQSPVHQRQQYGFRPEPMEYRQPPPLDRPPPALDIPHQMNHQRGRVQPRSPQYYSSPQGGPMYRPPGGHQHMSFDQHMAPNPPMEEQREFLEREGFAPPAPVPLPFGGFQAEPRPPFASPGPTGGFFPAEQEVMKTHSDFRIPANDPEPSWNTMEREPEPFMPPSTEVPVTQPVLDTSYQLEDVLNGTEARPADPLFDIQPEVVKSTPKLPLLNPLAMADTTNTNQVGIGRFQQRDTTEPSKPSKPQHIASTVNPYQAVSPKKKSPEPKPVQHSPKKPELKAQTKDDSEKKWTEPAIGSSLVLRFFNDGVEVNENGESLAKPSMESDEDDLDLEGRAALFG